MDVTPVLEFFREQDLALDGEIIRQSEWPTHPANDFPERDREQMPWSYHRVLTMRDNPLEAPGDWLDPRHAAPRRLRARLVAEPGVERARDRARVRA